MKSISTILVILFLPTLSFCQNLTKKVGVIEISFIQHNYILDSNDNPTKKIDNKAERPFFKQYFDSIGRILRVINFGDIDNNNLKEVNYIYDYSYVANTRTRTTYRYSKRRKQLYIDEILKTNYNDLGQKLTDSIFYIDPDSSKFFNLNSWAGKFFRDRQFVKFEYADNPKTIKTIHRSGDYILEKYDSLNRIISYREVADNKLIRESTYCYKDNKRVGRSQSYYKGIDNSTDTTIEIFDKEDFGISLETLSGRSPIFNRKEIYTLYPNGLRKRIDRYEMDSLGQAYILKSYTTLKIKSKTPLTKKIVLNMFRPD